MVSTPGPKVDLQILCWISEIIKNRHKKKIKVDLKIQSLLIESKHGKQFGISGIQSLSAKQNKK